MDNLLNSVKVKHGLDFGFIIFGIGALVLAISAATLILYVAAALFIAFGGYIFFSAQKKIKSHQYIRLNYKTNPRECLKIIEDDISSIKAAIAVDQRKADGGGRDSVDSADDVVRKTGRLEKFIAIKTEIEKYL